jgi:hypothetical protein
MTRVVLRFDQTQTLIITGSGQPVCTLNTSVTLAYRHLQMPSMVIVAHGRSDRNWKVNMLFFKCCTICDGDLLLEATDRVANLKCLQCDYRSTVLADTHLFNVLCEEDPHSQAAQSAA